MFPTIYYIFKIQVPLFFSINLVTLTKPAPINCASSSPKFVNWPANGVNFELFSLFITFHFQFCLFSVSNKFTNQDTLLLFCLFLLSPSKQFEDSFSLNQISHSEIDF